jgi:hypothetical protein
MLWMICAAAAANEGALLALTTPAGGEVFVDGNSVGVAPVSLGHLSAGEHLVEVKWPDGRIVSRIERVEPGATRVLQLSPEAPPLAAPPPAPPAPVAPAPVTSPPAPSPAPLAVSPPVAPRPPPPQIVVLAAPEKTPPAKKPVYKKAWLWAVVGVAAAAVVAVGVGVGVGVPSSSPPNRAGVLEF